MRRALPIALAAGLFGCATGGHEQPISPAPATRADTDGDGILDATDRCPTVPEDFDGDDDGDGCPESGGPGTLDQDRDGDGVADASDRCPDDPEDRDGFEDEDGCPEPDNDRDGVPDMNDQCPNEPETLNGRADTDGCPDR